MNGLLVRVAADQSFGGGKWNGPVNSATHDFVYVPIPEQYSARLGLNTSYSDPSLHSALAKIGSRLPGHLSGKATHLDPGFGGKDLDDRLIYVARVTGKLVDGCYYRAKCFHSVDPVLESDLVVPGSRPRMDLTLPIFGIHAALVPVVQLLGLLLLVRFSPRNGGTVRL